MGRRKKHNTNKEQQISNEQVKVKKSRKEPHPNTPLPDTNRFGDRLWWLMEVTGTTTEKLSNAINITKTQISHYRVKSRMPRFEVLLKIADYFDVSLDFLVGRSNTKAGCANFWESDW